MKLTDKLLSILFIPAAAMLSGCNGLFAGVYDEPEADPATRTIAGQLYVNASDWGKWHYLDLPSLADSVAADSLYNPSQAWIESDIPMDADASAPAASEAGIYTYWYDVFGEGISKNEFRDFMATAGQEEPAKWTIAVHRNNVRTNGCIAAATNFDSFDELPSDKTFLTALNFEEDRWSENEVWCIQDRMLLGLIGNQGIAVNPVLSTWLTIDIPPMPPAFTINTKVFILKLADGSHAAIQLADYIGPDGTKCCLTINYRYPL